MRYAVIIERGSRHCRAYAPDVPGCIATGPTWDDVLVELRDALASHLRGLHAEGLPIPEPTSHQTAVDVDVPSPDEPEPPAAVRKAQDLKTLFAQGLSRAEIARRVGIGRTSVRRILT
jgi:predicted RNase H-like HicB family nuclease